MALLIGLCVIGAWAAGAQEQRAKDPEAVEPAPAPGGAATPPLTIDAVEARLESLDEKESAPRELYEEALELLRQRAEHEAAAREFRQLTDEAEQRLASIREELEKPVEDLSPDLDLSAALVELEQREVQAAAELDVARRRVTELEAEAGRRQGRLTELPSLLAKARQRLKELEESPQITAAEGESPALTEARRLLRIAQTQALEAEIAALEAEAASYDARRDLLRARRDRAARRVEVLQRAVAAWAELANEKRLKEAEQAAQEVERLTREAARRHPVLREFAAEIDAMATRRAQEQGVPQAIAEAKREMADFRARLEEMRKQYAVATRRIEASGVNRAVGLFLRRQYESLPDLDELSRRVTAIHRELVEAELQMIER